MEWVTLLPNMDVIVSFYGHPLYGCHMLPNMNVIWVTYSVGIDEKFPEKHVCSELFLSDVFNPILMGVEWKNISDIYI